MPASTITLQNVLNYAMIQGGLTPLTNVAGFANEPGLSICIDAMSDLITSPNDWKFNQVDLPMLVTAVNKQDYLFAGACAFTLQSGLATGSASTGAAIAITNGVTVGGSVVTVTTLEPHRFNVGDTVYHNGVVMTTGNSAAYNSTFTDNGVYSAWTNGWPITAVTPNSYSFAAVPGQNNSDAGGAPGITNYGWLASATAVEMNNGNSPQRSIDLEAVKTLQPWSMAANPEKVCVYKDFGNGVLKIRFWYVPSTVIWGAKLVIQAAAPVFTELTQTWAPFPDNMSSVYRQAVLYRVYRYLNKPTADAEYQKLQAEITKAQGFDDAEDSDVHMCPSEGSIGSGTVWFWGS